MFSNELTKGKALRYLLLFLIVSVVIRLPNLDRPISKHHEFNTALILIGVESWQQAGGASALHFIPVMNYQQKGDYSFKKDELTDDKGNYLYMSFGPGWYIIPYLFFNCFNLSPTPLNLQILNLLFFAVTVLVLFFLLERIWSYAGIKKKYTAVLTSCMVFIFSPNILWFFGNGYVCTGIVLPFVIVILLISFNILTHPGKINPWSLPVLFVLGIIAIYIDWFGVFIMGSLGCISLFFIRKNRNIAFFTATCFITLIIGIAIPGWQFSSYIGSDQLMLYWQNRFNKRSFFQDGNSWPLMLYRIGGHFVTSYLPSLCLLLFLYFAIRTEKRKLRLSYHEKLLLIICLCALLPFSLVFIEWTKVHDFSIIPYSLLFSFLAGVFILRLSSTQLHRTTLIVFIILSTAQYYAINRPGKFSQNHSLYSREMDLGNSIKKLAPVPYVIFTNLPLSPMTEYYAKRKLHNNSSLAEAQKLTSDYPISKSIWIEVRNDSIAQVQVIKN